MLLAAGRLRLPADLNDGWCELAIEAQIQYEYSQLERDNGTVLLPVDVVIVENAAAHARPAVARHAELDRANVDRDSTVGYGIYVLLRQFALDVDEVGYWHRNRAT